MVRDKANGCVICDIEAFGGHLDRLRHEVRLVLVGDLFQTFSARPAEVCFTKIQRFAVWAV